MATPQIDKVVNIYHLLCKYPSLSNARISNFTKNGLSINSVWYQKNIVKNSKVQFKKNFNLDKDFNVVGDVFPIESAGEIARCATNDEQRVAVFKQTIVDNAPKAFIEIWEKRGLHKCYDLSVYDVHGEIYTDIEFSSFSWAPDKKKIVYVAEKKAPKSEPFYKQKNADKVKENQNGDEISRGTEYIFKPDWGEQLVGKHQSVAVVLNVEEDTIKVVESIPENYFLGQVQWTPNGEDLVGVVWEREPIYLGLYACTNRPSWIFLFKNSEMKLLTSDGLSVKALRFSPDGEKLVYLERDASTPHHQNHRLKIVKWDENANEFEIETLIDNIDESQTIEEGKTFFGLFNRSLAQRCWSLDSKYVFLSTPQRNSVKSYFVHTETKAITEIENDNSSLIVLDVKNDHVAFMKTSLMQHPNLAVGKFDFSKKKLGDLNLTLVSTFEETPGFENLMVEHNEYKYDTEEEINEFSFTYFGCKGGEEKSVPLLITGHGGPHSCFENRFSVGSSVFALMGFAIVQVNYRGSTGMGKKNVEYLEGKVGDVDVKDCVIAMKEALKKYPWLNPDQVGVYGGSHGGFLTAHLTGSYPNMFKVAAMINPVIDISSMLASSDIPDWCLAVSNFSTLKELMSKNDKNYPDALLKLYSKSPIVHVDKVKTPTLVLLGKNDLRVPFFQGKLWYRRLATNNVKTKLIVYDDCHSLLGDPLEMDSVINLSLWFLEHMKSKKEKVL